MKTREEKRANTISFLCDTLRFAQKEQLALLEDSVISDILKKRLSSLSIWEKEAHCIVRGVNFTKVPGMVLVQYQGSFFYRHKTEQAINRIWSSIVSCDFL